ncbi:MAG: ATP-dependent DNA helicase [Candidatus Firestonebacteria bacterium GWA2_43_8]|nr:MAG: ATP-dependent DNA helicase [Candidatus Firestonebacteria bacterium GWA2_43_8]
MEWKETEALEFKRSTSELKEAVISIAAILNKHLSGELYFGVKNDGEAVGQQIGPETIRNISREVANSVEPKIYPSITKISLNNKTCIKVHFKGKETPYYAYGRAYIRVADEDRKMSAKELENFILEKNKDRVRWDSEICSDAKLKDISPVKLKNFLELSGLKYDNTRDSLNKLKLLKQEKLLNTAVILFGKKPQDLLLNTRLRCGVFATTDTVTPIDMKDFEGDLFTLIKKAEEYIFEHINIGMRLEGFRRVDVPEIDKEAFREAVINAFCHRDYYNNDAVHVAIFRDRLEVRSPGLLYGGLTIAGIKEGKSSERRNELLAEMLHRVHFVERWGKGIQLILSKEPTADFEEIGRKFFTVFKRKNVSGIVSAQPVQKGSEKGSEKSSEKILAIIRDNNRISTREIAVILKRSTRAIEKQIAALKKQGSLKRIGPDKGGYWQAL